MSKKNMREDRKKLLKQEKETARRKHLSRGLPRLNIRFVTRREQLRKENEDSVISLKCAIARKNFKTRLEQDEKEYLIHTWSAATIPVELCYTEVKQPYSLDKISIN